MEILGMLLLSIGSIAGGFAIHPMIGLAAIGFWILIIAGARS
jgi:hypothetical protein